MMRILCIERDRRMHIIQMHIIQMHVIQMHIIQMHRIQNIDYNSENTMQRTKCLEYNA